MDDEDLGRRLTLYVEAGATAPDTSPVSGSPPGGERWLVRYLAWRVGASLVMLVVISIGVFAMLRLAPGGPETLLLGSRPPTPEAIAAIRAKHHLDEPVVQQYTRWATSVLTLDLGESARTDEPVGGAIRKRAMVTFGLVALAFPIAVVVGVGLGALAAYRRGRPVDRAITSVSVVGVSTPAFASALALLYVFAYLFGWFPVFGEGEGLLDRIHHLVLPAAALAVTGVGFVVKFSRAAIGEVLAQDYVTAAYGRGVPGRRIFRRYVLRNSLVPIVTAGGLLLGSLLAGTLLVEFTFSLDGIGRLFVASVQTKDVPVVQGVAMLVSTGIVGVNLLTDLVYVAVDPRVRLGAAE